MRKWFVSFAALEMIKGPERVGGGAKESIRMNPWISLIKDRYFVGAL